MLSVDTAGDYDVTARIYEQDNTLMDYFTKIITIEKSGKDKNGTPGFEALLLVIAAASIIFIINKRKKHF